jgi:hypothetical protein
MDNWNSKNWIIGIQKIIGYWFSLEMIGVIGFSGRL